MGDRSVLVTFADGEELATEVSSCTIESGDSRHTKFNSPNACTSGDVKDIVRCGRNGAR